MASSKRKRSRKTSQRVESEPIQRDVTKSKNRWRPWVFRLMALVLPLVILESAARCYWYVREAGIEAAKTDNQRYEEAIAKRAESDDEIPYWFNPHDEMIVDKSPTKTNNMNLRGDEDMALEPDYSGTRIVCIGDSVTFGYSVTKNDKCYPALLQRRLRAAGAECFVLNMGMPRFRVAHSKLMLAEFAKDHSCDVLVLLGGWNNANDEILQAPAGNSVLSFLNRHWYMLRCVQAWRMPTSSVLASRQEAIVSEDGLTAYAKGVEGLIALGNRMNAKTIVCTLPHFFHNVEAQAARERMSDYLPVGTFEQIAATVDRMNDRLREIAASSGAGVVELGEINDHKLFADAIHPNDEGTAIVARKVGDFLLEKKLVEIKPKMSAAPAP